MACLVGEHRFDDAKTNKIQTLNRETFHSL